MEPRDEVTPSVRGGGHQGARGGTVRRAIRWQAGPATVLLLAFLVLPLLFLGRTSLYPADRSFGAAGWSLAPLREILR